MKKNTSLLFVVSILILTCVGFIILLFSSKKNETSPAPNPAKESGVQQKTKTIAVQEDQINITEKEVRVDEQEAVVPKGLKTIVIGTDKIKWLSDREEIDQKGAKESNGEQISYYKIANIIGGELEGYELKLTTTAGMGVAHDIYAQKDDNIYLFVSDFMLERLSNDTQEDRSVAFRKKLAWLKDNYNEDFAQNISFHDDTILDIEQLQFNSELNIEVNGKKEHLVRHSSFGPTVLGDRKIDKNLLVATEFEHPEYGTAYISRQGVESGDERSILSANGVYFEAPMDTFAVYSLLPKITEDKEESDYTYSSNLDVEWNDQSYDNEYNVQNFYGCGVTSFAQGGSNKEYSKIREDDLKIVGKTFEGREIYAFKDVNHPFMVESFERGQTMFEAPFLKEQLEKEGVTSLENVEDYFKINPFIIYKDAFERWHTVTRIIFQSPAECGKPVIYLYPEQEMDVNVQVEPTKGFTKVDPVYPDGGWNVKAYPDGKLFNHDDQKEYPYLFWEGLSDVFYGQPRKGFVSSREDLSSTFDKTLAAQNLQGREIVDFKEFWVPKMLEDDAPYFFITYTTEEFINAAAPLWVTPQPDTMIRIMMDYEPMSSPDERGVVAPIEFDPKERKGFTVIEWGGMLGK